ncbi:MAG: surface-adhesin E family protein [Alphaproteobacteria bacterium]
MSLRNTTLLAVAVLMAAGPALAEEWRKVSVDATTGAVKGIDAASISGPENARSANIALINKQAVVMQNVAIEYSVDRREIDCVRRTIATRHLALYSATGLLQEVDITTPATAITPNSVGETLANAICKRVWLATPAPVNSAAEFFRTQRAAQLGK